MQSHHMYTSVAVFVMPIAIPLLIITCAIVHPSNAASTTDKICITGSSIQTLFEGVYDYAYYDANRAGTVYYNNESDIYLFPEIYNDEFYWRIGSDPYDTTVKSYCNVTSTVADASLYTFDAYDCYSEWKTWNGEWTDDSEMKLVNCNDICISGCDLSVYDGTYVWNHYNHTFQGSVYYCTSCKSDEGAYLFPWMYSDGGSYWLISRALDDWSIGYCWVGWNTYIFGLPDCDWYTWIDDGWVSEPDMTVERCVAESVYTCTDKCYLRDETATCSDDCDCSSTKICSVSGDCEGIDSFWTTPFCAEMFPTIAPTNPTQAPTSCEVYTEYSKYDSNELSFDDQDLKALVNAYTEMSVNDTTYFVANDSNNYLDELLQCSNTDCFIHCSTKASCLLSVIEHSGMNNNDIIISCDDEYACFGAQITSQVDAQYHVISIICNATDSCNQMSLNILKPESLNIYCLQPQSCHAMDVYVEIDTDTYNSTDHGIIHCVSAFGCDFIHITTNSEFTQLRMYEYSSNVIFDNGIGYLSAEGNILCNNDRYITFRSWITETEQTITSSIENEYSAQRYPCDDIVVKCGDFECVMSYYIDSVEIQSLNDMISTDCYYINMQQLQRITCTGACAGSPTDAPTAAPTNTPTEPTTAPTIDPTSDPTIDPTTDPTSSPTQLPSNAPTTAPSLAPSVAPTVPPSLAPSIAPSLAPSMFPTATPSTPPSHAPSRSPTDNVEGLFDTKIVIDYELGNLTAENKQYMVYTIQSVKPKLQEIIQSGYFDTDLLQYDRFMLSIMEINDVDVVEEVSVSANADADSALTVYDLDINNILGIPIILSSEIDTSNQDSGYMITKSGTTPFRENIQQELRIYFDNDDIYFNVSHSNALIAITSTPPASETESNTAIYLSVFILSMGGSMSAMAFVFNKKQGTKVDNAVFIMPLMLALNIYDFVSDVNLSINIFSNAFEEETLNNIVFYLGVASIFFLILPYCSNLFYAMQIINQPAIKQNPAARAWFTAHFRHFLLLVVFTAGTYPVLSLTSSRIFGLDFFNAGLLSTDLKALSRIKIISTIYLENGPQLIIQILYSMRIGLEGDTVLAFVASSLSIIATLMIYKAEQSQEDVVIAKYFIQFWNESGLNTDERQKIVKRRGLKERLAEALCSVFTISKNSIEIGYVTPNQNGCIIHVQHSIFQEDLDSLKEDLFSEQLTSGYNIHVTEHFYVENAFKVMKDDLCEVLVKHFALEESDHRLEFNVAYHKRYKDANPLELRGGKLLQTQTEHGNRADLLQKIKTFHASTRNIGATQDLMVILNNGESRDDDEGKYDDTYLDIDVGNRGNKRNKTSNKDNMQLEIELANIPKDNSEFEKGTKTTATGNLLNAKSEINIEPNVMNALNLMRKENKEQQQRVEKQMNAMLKMLNALDANGDNSGGADDIQVSDAGLSQLHEE